MSENEKNSVDMAVFAPHPDDAELACGGLLIKMAARGYRTAVVDLTRGEIGTRGDAEIRAQEAARAAEIMGLAERVNLELPDGAVESNVESRHAVATVIRRLRPAVVLLPYWEDRHPDHYNGSRVVSEGVHLARLQKYDAPGKPFRVRRQIYTMGRIEFAPSFVVDITEELGRKMEAIRAYASQLHKPGRDEPPTDIGSKDYLNRLEARHITCGAMIRAPFGEPYLVKDPLRIDDPVAMFRREVSR